VFKKILIANRGEIACRVIRTARRLGVKTVAVYSDADASALHVAMADESVRIGPASVSESYLKGDVIVDAALATSAEAIHPGYGFLSENPEFVELVEKEDLCFIGPSASSIRAMGLKDAAKKLMQQASVPVVPGYHGEHQDAQFLKQQAEDIGYPVLIKARSGGGGKGMRLVEDSAGFTDSLASAQREAEASFADAACLIEKYVTAPRHIEIQVFGDDHGNVVHLFERDCSLQRRHQKVIEEAPAPGMSEEMRQAMGSAAVEAAKAIDYSGAGTVEFIVDSSDGLRPDRFWFMEMNTRLQVEHPVTEAITGCDLVEWQLLVASGEKLPLSQSELSINGWAMEARIYAEDVEKGFLPATGTLHYLDFPSAANSTGADIDGNTAVRVDTGVRAGDTISPFYDPMIAKLIVHGATREQARLQLLHALRGCHAAGSVTNINFLSDLTENVDFASGDVDTGLIERYSDDLAGVKSVPDVVVASAALEAAGVTRNSDSFTAFSLWQPMLHSIKLKNHRGEEILVALEGNSDTDWQISVDGRVHSYSMQGNNRVIFDGETVDIVCHFYGASKSNPAAVSVFSDRGWHFSVPDPLDGDGGDEAGGDLVVAPMPGQVKLVSVAKGDVVVAGDALIVMEAMKMEHTLAAPRDGSVEEILAAVGDQVEDGAILLRLTEED